MNDRPNGHTGHNGLGAASTVAMDGDAYATVGEWLAARRAALGRTLEQAEDATRVREDYLDAIETMDPRRMPEGPYAPGFVRTYAIYLDLDPEAVAERFRTEMSPRRARRPKMEVETQPIRVFVPPRIAIGGGVAVLLIVLAYLGLKERAASEGLVPPVPEGLMEWVEADIAGARTSVAPEIVGGPELALRARVPVFLEAHTTDGEALIERDMDAGETWTVPRLRGVVVSADNGGGVEVLRDGRAEGRLGPAGLPVSNWNADAGRGLAPLPLPLAEEPVEPEPEPEVAAIVREPVATPADRVSETIETTPAAVDVAVEAGDSINTEPEPELISPELPTDSDEIVAEPLPFLFVGDVTPPADNAEDRAPEDERE